MKEVRIKLSFHPFGLQEKEQHLILTDELKRAKPRKVISSY